MKNSKLKTLMVGTSIICLASSLNPVLADAAWKQDSHGWWNTEGSSWSVGWRQIDGQWYYFGSDGYMKTGWLYDGNNWYYLEASGAMKTDWVKYNNDWYYLDESGVMKTGWIVDRNSNKWYYLDENGAMVSNNLVDNRYVGKDGAAVEDLSTLITMTTEKKKYKTNTKEIKFTINNQLPATATFKQESFKQTSYVEKYENNQWVELEYDLENWIKTNYIDKDLCVEPVQEGVNDYVTIPGYSSRKEVCSLDILKDYANLKPGKYRIRKDFYFDDYPKTVHSYAEFELV